jgi:hypothetical protein
MRAPAEPFVGLELTSEALDIRRSEPEDEQLPEVVTSAPVPARTARRLLWGSRRRD